MIISVHTMSYAALSSGALSLSETYILTREAIEDYWNHLTPNGTLLITRPLFQSPSSSPRHAKCSTIFGWAALPTIFSRLKTLPNPSGTQLVGGLSASEIAAPTGRR